MRYAVLITAFVIANITPGYCDRRASPAKATKPKVELTVTNWKGVQKLVAKHKGKVVVVDIWTTTCPICMAKFPEFQALAKPHGDKVALISVNCDFDGIKDKPPKHCREGVLKFLRKQNATFDNVMLNIPFIAFLNKIELESTPALLVYDKTGKLVKRFDNDDSKKAEDDFTMKQVAELVNKLVQQNAAK